MSGRGVLATVACWLPVTAVVVALFVVPGTTEAAGPRPLTVRPGANTYGGQQLIFSGDMGNGVQRIRLQRRDRLGSPWGTVIDPRTGRTFSRLTKANGSFSFDFPAPAMNGTYFRVASGGNVTRAHQFETVHQDVDMSLVELTQADVPLPRGFVVASEGFQFAADTADHDRFGKPTKPILQGRVVTLQVRAGDGWNDLETATVGHNGKLNFGNEVRRALTGATPEVYRVVMENWTEAGDRVGWMPSVPFYLEVVRRPDAVRNVVFTATPSSVTLTWSLPNDPERAKIVIARTSGAGAPPPTAGTPHHVIATIQGGATAYRDTDVLPNRTYRYAVYTVSHDGVYTRVPELVIAATPAAKVGER